MAGSGVRDSTLDSFVDLTDAGNYRFKLSTKLNTSNGAHIPRIFLGEGDDSLSSYGVQKVVTDLSLFHGTFTFDVPPALWLLEEDGVEIATSTRMTSVKGRLDCTSGAVAGNKSVIEGRRHPRYQPNRGLKWASSIGFKGANLDGILKAGFIQDDENGIYYKTKGDGNLYACVLSGGVETHEELITFPFDIDITKGNNYDIQVQWRGVGNIKFTVFSPVTGVGVTVHEIKLLNTLDEEVGVENPAMPASYYAENVTQEVSLWSGCCDISSEGGLLSKEQYGSLNNTTATLNSGDPILELRVPQLINTKPNSRDIRLARLTFSSDKKTTIKVYRTRNSSGVTGGSYSTFLTGSFLEVNTTITSVTVGSMDLFSTFIVPAGGTVERDNPNKAAIDFVLVKGDSVVVVCDTGSIVEVDTILEWGEEI